MRSPLLLLTVVAILGTTATAIASGGQPPLPQPDPPAYTLVAAGVADRPVRPPARRTDARIDRAVRAAQTRALPDAIAVAQSTASDLARASGLRRGAIVAIRRDVAPPPYFDGDSGVFGIGVWCGRIYDGRRTVRRPDGTTHRVSHYHHGCRVPHTATVRVTVTFAATPLVG